MTTGVYELLFQFVVFGLICLIWLAILIKMLEKNTQFCQDVKTFCRCQFDLRFDSILTGANVTKEQTISLLTFPLPYSTIPFWLAVYAKWRNGALARVLFVSQCKRKIAWWIMHDLSWAGECGYVPGECSFHCIYFIFVLDTNGVEKEPIDYFQYCRWGERERRRDIRNRERNETVPCVSSDWTNEKWSHRSKNILAHFIKAAIFVTYVQYFRFPSPFQFFCIPSNCASISINMRVPCGCHLFGPQFNQNVADQCYSMKYLSPAVRIAWNYTIKKSPKRN